LTPHLASSALVRLLGAGAPAATAPAGGLAESLGAWVNAFDAIELQATHQSLKGVQAPASRRTTRVAGAELAQDVERARAALVKSIAADANPLQEPGYSPFQRRHGELQRQMDQMIGVLRDHVRQSLARSSSQRLRQLAVLDAGLEKVVGRREQALLPRIALLLERRFKQTAGEGFEPHWREAMVAELELRLEPVAGLVDAAIEEMDA
jgi:hypothetical protein